MLKLVCWKNFAITAIALLGAPPVLGQGIAEELELDPKIVEESPVLQRWFQEVPDVLEDLRTEPAVPTRVEAGIADFDERLGTRLAIEDLYLGKTRLSVAGNYWQSFESRSVSWGAQLRYFVRPLGRKINFAPVVGYRSLGREEFTRDGVAVGGRLVLALSPGGGADASITQLFVSPGSDREVSRTVFAAGYALSDRLRLATTVQRIRSNTGTETDASIGLAWLLR